MCAGCLRLRAAALCGDRPRLFLLPSYLARDPAVTLGGRATPGLTEAQRTKANAFTGVSGSIATGFRFPSQR